MKESWLKLAARVDALSLRERVLVFAAAASVIVFAAYFASLGPMFGRYAALRGQIGQQQDNLVGLDGEIAQKIRQFQRDPDAETRARIETALGESAQLGEGLRAMQKGLVPPERMAPLIDAILRANGRLRLVSMRTLPVTSLNEAKEEKPEAKPAAAPQLSAARSASAAQAAVAPSAWPATAAGTPAATEPKPGGLLYRHGVEITVRGNYLDMIDYMNALETLPTQLFWSGAQLDVEDYPTSRLTLTLYTLSLDQKWLKL
jgi:MSHA biogenesis protein MshJ